MMSNESERNESPSSPPESTPSKRKVQIVTSGFVDEDEVRSPEGSTEQAGTSPHPSKIPAPWSKSEPLTKIHSLLGHMAQGDVYRNELDLVFDRIKGDAERPEFIATPQQSHSESKVSLKAVNRDQDLTTAQGEPQLTTAPLQDPFEEINFEFAMSAGEISEEASLEIELPSEEPIPAPKTSILADIDLEDFERLQEVAALHEELDSSDPETHHEESEDLFMHLSEPDENWEEAKVDPAQVEADLQRRSSAPFFEHQDTATLEFNAQGFADRDQDEPQDELLSTSLTEPSASDSSSDPSSERSS